MRTESVARLHHPVGMVLLICLMAAFQGVGTPLQAQERRPLALGHWSHDLLEVVHALGAPGPGFLFIRGVSGAANLGALRGHAGAGTGGEEGGEDRRASSSDLQLLLETWTGRMEAEVGGSSRDWAPPVHTELETGWSKDPTLSVRSPELYGKVLVAGEVRPGWSAWGELRASQGITEEAVRSLGISLPLGTFDLSLGRTPVFLGQGRDSFVLSGRAPTNGAFITSRETFRLPGMFQGMGLFRFHMGISPHVSTPTTSSAWFGSYALTWSPHPRLDFAALRTTRFAGKGIQRWSTEAFLRMLVGQGENDSFDGSRGEAAARVRWGILGQPVTTYLSLGFEDKTSITEDPGLLMGVLLPRLRPEALYTLRYEFMAIGPRAYWCSSCFKTHHAWYRHPAFGDYVYKGEPLGALLGGYGAMHLVEAEAWLTRRPVRGWLTYRKDSRGRANILLDSESLPVLAPAESVGWTLGVEAFIRGRWAVSGSLHSATLDGNGELGLTANVRVIAGG